MQYQFPGSRNPAVLEHVNPLIGAEHHSPTAYGDVELGLGESPFDVRRHVVWPFCGVAVEMQFLGNEFLEEGLEIVLHIWVDIFLDQERGGGVPNEYGQKALAHGLFGKPRCDFAGDFIKPLFPRTQGQRMLDLFHRSLGPWPSRAALVLAA